MKDDRLYLIYILECIERIETYTTSGEAEFFRNSMVRDAVLRNLHTLTESTQRLSIELKANYPDVAWADISGFRNVVVHDYLGIDPEQIWIIVKSDLPELKQHIKQILEDMEAASQTVG